MKQIGSLLDLYLHVCEDINLRMEVVCPLITHSGYFEKLLIGLSHNSEHEKHTDKKGPCL